MNGPHVPSGPGRHPRPAPPVHRFHETFRCFAQKISELCGTALMFFLALLVILIWGLTGPLFHYSDTWQLVINTGTTIVTFLMVFLIQNTQNRDAKAIHLKLDELLRAVAGARTKLVDLEDMTDEELEELQKQFLSIRDRASRRRKAAPAKKVRGDESEKLAEPE